MIEHCVKRNELCKVLRKCYVLLIKCVVFSLYSFLSLNTITLSFASLPKFLVGKKYHFCLMFFFFFQVISLYQIECILKINIFKCWQVPIKTLIFSDVRVVCKHEMKPKVYTYLIHS